MNGGEFKNFYPVEKPGNTTIPAKIKPRRVNRLSITNTGQILVICFLSVIILLQAVNIISAMAESKPDFADNQGRNADKISSGANQAPAINIPKPDIENERNLDNNINNITDNTDINRNADKSPGVIFILGETDGKLAIFSPDGKTVYETFDIYINTLPDFDKNLLINGIKIKTADELHSLLEDYGS